MAGIEKRWIGFKDFNVVTHTEAEARVRALYDGNLKFPTVIAGTDFIKNPTVPQLSE
ncbi:hypothetical protein Q0590_26895 [Rhodocytophaga aerolata]|uniref:Uncharacterized protein n=1 Tax=Rhodocytophaga aerolata TaxID=455078 RepID=A0ABT8RE18_9BACT|nr:hypothetical protein [Rhodocytophaga aerolata]MDO1449936.1 hypothetical protein [Rhodocytophaga aerolata]